MFISILWQQCPLVNSMEKGRNENQEILNIGVSSPPPPYGRGITLNTLYIGSRRLWDELCPLFHAGNRVRGQVCLVCSLCSWDHTSQPCFHHRRLPKSSKGNISVLSLHCPFSKSAVSVCTGHLFLGLCLWYNFLSCA